MRQSGRAIAAPTLPNSCRLLIRRGLPPGIRACGRVRNSASPARNLPRTLRRILDLNAVDPVVDGSDGLGGLGGLHKCGSPLLETFRPSIIVSAHTCAHLGGRSQSEPPSTGLPRCPREVHRTWWLRGGKQRHIWRIEPPRSHLGKRATESPLHSRGSPRPASSHPIRYQTPMTFHHTVPMTSHTTRCIAPIRSPFSHQAFNST